VFVWGLLRRVEQATPGAPLGAAERAERTPSIHVLSVMSVAVMVLEVVVLIA
jgi:hypothetical protein